MRNLKKRIRELLRRKRPDIFLAAAFYVLILALMSAGGPFVITIFSLRLPMLTNYSPATPLAACLALCFLLPKFINMKRVLLLFAAAALAQLVFFEPAPLTKNRPNAEFPARPSASKRLRAPKIPTEPNRNLLIISVGNLRPDRMSGFGAVRDTTLHIDRLAAGGMVFANAYSNVPSAAAAHATLFTGLLPSAHGVSEAPFAPLKDDAKTLAALMRRGGWKTEAVIERGALPPAFNLGLGFDRYDDSPTDLPAAVELAVRRLEENRNKKLFLFFHTNRLALPFNPPAPYHTAYSRGCGGNRTAVSLAEASPTEAIRTKASLGCVIDADTLAPVNAGNLALAPADKERIIALYDAELLYADTRLGRLLSHLRASGAMRDTVVVFLSDHGETLGEHGGFGDARRSLHEEALRIPLFLIAPGVRPQTVGLRVSLVDILPTLLDLFEILFDKAGFQGESLIPRLSGAAGDATPGNVYAETGRGGKKAALAGRYKFIRDADPEGSLSRFNTAQNLVYFTRGREFYDLRRDPREQNNLVLRDSPRARLMEKLLK